MGGLPAGKLKIVPRNIYFAIFSITTTCNMQNPPDIDFLNRKTSAIKLPQNSGSNNHIYYSYKENDCQVINWAANAQLQAGYCLLHDQ